MDKLILPPCATPPSRGPHPVDPMIPRVCENEKTPLVYHDIAYLVGSDRFYLLTEEACHYLSQAEKKLDGVTGEDPEAMAESGLLDGTTVAHLSSFLSASQDRDEYHKLEEWLNTPDRGLFGLEKARHEKDTVKKRRELKSLQKKALEGAKQKGYSYKNGALYTPRETQIHTLLKQYANVKQTFLDKKELAPAAQVAALQDNMDLRRLIGKEGSAIIGPVRANIIAYYEAEQALEVTSEAFNALVTCIEDLEKLGVAMPECALALDGQDGHTALADYYQLLHDAQTFEDSLRERLMALSKSTDYRRIPPSAILADEYTQLKELENKANILHNRAHELASEHRLLLVWSPDDYKEKPLQRLMTDRFPLREYLLGTPKPGASQVPLAQLRYLSLVDVPHPTNPSGTLMIVDFTATASLGKAFEHILSQGLATPIPIEDGWFDEKGLFAPEHFHASLAAKRWEVKSLKADTTTWDTAVSGILYRDFIKKRLDPFDSAPQAQFFRFSTEAFAHDYTKRISNFTYEESSSRMFERGRPPTDSNSQGWRAVQKVEAKYNLYAAKGELNVIQASNGQPYLSFPDEKDIDAKKDITLLLRVLNKHDGKPAKEETIAFNPGLLRTRLYIKAYGFAGATLAGQKEMRFESGGLSALTQLQSSDATLNLEAKIGVEMACYLDWFLPDRSLDGINVPDFIVPNDVKMLTTLKGQLKVELEGKVSSPLLFKFVNGKLHVRMQVGQSFKFVIEGEVMPQAIGAWIWQFQRVLREANYRPVDIVEDDETFQALSTMSRVCLLSQMQIGLFFAHKKDVWDKVMGIFEGSSAPTVAHLLAFGTESALKPWLQMLVPEGLAPLIETLLSEPDAASIKESKDVTTFYNEDDVLAMQQIGLMKIFMWLHELWSQRPSESAAVVRQVEEALSRLQRNHGMPQQRKLDFMANCDRIRAMLNRSAYINPKEKPNLSIAYSRTGKSFSHHHFNDLVIVKYNEVKQNKAQLEQEVIDLKQEALKEGMTSRTPFQIPYGSAYTF
ncbi:hypothetical protein LRP50_06480 [Enterovibrio sp. ZSDZ42]|uniref:Uncharacterized protein n=1 Tax=Enterovibrio gelatinilyticus TaxID=2899819 RepID=A0ABT5QXM0_9GAMM|nr:hypothetical protein [Enterovibrio sp. ZSDZ42]MDD1792766.1 hypothetical protein [Enterovibrio sp. ZSDZ42]